MGELAQQNDLEAHKRTPATSAHGIMDLLGTTTTIKSRAQFRGYVSSAQNNLTYNTFVQVVLDGESYDRGECFATYAFTAQEDGLHEFIGQVGISTAQINKAYTLAIYVDAGAGAANVSQRVVYSNGNGDNVYLSIHDMIDLDAGDIVTLWIKSLQGDGTADIITGSTNSFFAGHIYAV